MIEGPHLQPDRLATAAASAGIVTAAPQGARTEQASEHAGS